VGLKGTPQGVKEENEEIENLLRGAERAIKLLGILVLGIRYFILVRSVPSGH